MEKELTEAIKAGLTKIDARRNAHLDLGLQMLKAYSGALYGLDMLAVGAIKRSMAHCSGFCMLIEKWNFVCAASIVRLQLDNALRFYAAFLVDKPHDFAVSVLGGTPIRKLRDRHGKFMRDDYLVECLSKEYPWIPRVYKETSGYIHLSEKHIFNAIAGVQDKDRSVKIEISSEDIDFPEWIYLEAIDAFVASTDIFLRYLKGWIFTKDNPQVVETYKHTRRQESE